MEMVRVGEKVGKIKAWEKEGFLVLLLVRTFCSRYEFYFLSVQIASM